MIVVPIAVRVVGIVTETSPVPLKAPYPKVIRYYYYGSNECNIIVIVIII